MGQPYPRQIAHLEDHLRQVLSRHVSLSAWHPTATGPEAGFRNKAKLVIAGSRSAPTFGILDGQWRGVDLRDCGLYEPGLHEALANLLPVVAAAGLTPYDVSRRSGEAKHLVVTRSPNDEFMLRFVLRSPGQLARVRDALPPLRRAVPGVRVVSINLQPEHKAVLEGDDEIVLTDEDTLPMRVGPVTLHLRPDSFFQTNTAVAEQLYAQAAEWVDALSARTLWDLYCGVGGFGLTIGSRTPLAVKGIERSPGGIVSAQRTAAELGQRGQGSGYDFQVGDAEVALRGAPPPDVVLVNPPRRGIGSLAALLDQAAPPHILYSSCNADSLARDLDAMPSYAVRAARAFDMFPQTRHHEVLVLLERAR